MNPAVRVFGNPIHPNGGCIFGNGSPIAVENPRPDTHTGGATKRKPVPTWRDYAIHEDDLEVIEIVSILLMADVL